MGKEVLNKLTNILVEAESRMAALEGGAGSVEQVLADVRRSLREFHKAAVTLGIKGLIRVVTEMETFANKAATSPENLDTLAHALSSLRRGIQDATAESIRAGIMDALKLCSVEPLDMRAAEAASQSLDSAVAEGEDQPKPGEEAKEAIEPESAREVPEGPADVRGESALYQEIGMFARRVDDLLKGLDESISAQLRESGEDQMPGTGNRLEHFLHLTEQAASTTLDHAKAVQKRIQADQEKLDRLERHFAMLKPIGDGAHGRMDESARIVKELRESLAMHKEDVGAIVASQSHQHLAGKIVGKIVNFQKDLEGRLVNLVRSFGAKGKIEVQ